MTRRAASPGRRIVLRNVETGVETRTQSNAAGVYVVLNISTRQLHAFRNANRDSARKTISEFRLAVNQTATFDFSLDVQFGSAVSSP